MASLGASYECERSSLTEWEPLGGGEEEDDGQGIDSVQVPSLLLNMKLGKAHARPREAEELAFARTCLWRT